MLKRHMIANKGATKVAHKGKGSQQAPMPDRGQIGQLARGPGSINDYAKATPMAQPGDGDMPMPSNPIGGGF